MTAAVARVRRHGLLRIRALFGGCYARLSSFDFAEARRRVKAPLATLAADAALTRQRAPVRIGSYLDLIRFSGRLL